MTAGLIFSVLYMICSMVTLPVLGIAAYQLCRIRELMQHNRDKG